MPYPAQATRLEDYPDIALRRPGRRLFSLRSEHRPNPIGLHRISVVEIVGGSLRVEPLEAVDGTPVIDLKPVLDANDR